MADPDDKPKKSVNTRFKQQTLPAWKPNLTAGTALPTLFVVGILCIPVGFGILFFSENVLEETIDYTDCVEAGSTTGRTCAEVLNASPNVYTSCQCEPITFTLKESMHGRVYIFYALTNFYQSHRRYVKSRDDEQLFGDALKYPVKECIPFAKDSGGKYIYPCGSIANAFFSDVIKLYKDGEEVPLKKKGIASEIGIGYPFKNPDFWSAAQGNAAHPAWTQITKPKAWGRELWEWKDGVEDEDFGVWMRISAKPNFRKLYRFVDHDGKNSSVLQIQKGLPAGKYVLNVTYSYRVTHFSGTKSVLLTTSSILGGKNPFLGIAYIVIGGIFLLLGLLFLFLHIGYGEKNFIKPVAVTERSSTFQSARQSSHGGQRTFHSQEEQVDQATDT